MTDSSLSFTDDFAVPEFAEFEARVAKDLRGRPYAEVAWAQPDGAPIPPVVTHRDTDELPHLQPAPQSWLGRRGPWQIRELVVSPDPATAAAHASTALADGADEIELCFDDLVLDAREPGDDENPLGVSGVAIHDLGAFRTAVDGISLDRVHLGISAGEGASAALAYLLCVAEERGIEPTKLHADLDFDPIAQLTQRQARFDDDDNDLVVSTHTSPQHAFDECAEIVRFCAERCPSVRPIVIDTQGFHLAAASPAEELGASIAQVIDMARELNARGVSFDLFARSTTVRVQVSHELLSEVAKLRALRLLWAKVAHAFEASEVESHAPYLRCVTSGRSRSYRFDTRTNLLRTTLAGFAAITGGCNSLTIVPFDEDPANQDDTARRLARHQQALLRDESHLDAVIDPAGGSFAIESLTHRFAARAWEHLRAIERVGGACAALRDGSLFELVVATAERRTRDFAERRRVLVGINRYVDPGLEGSGPADPAAAEATTERLTQEHAARLASRDSDAARAAVDTVDTTDNWIDGACAAARAGATTGEIARATWPNTEFRHRFPPVALLDGDEFEELRELREGEPTKALIVRLSDAPESRSRATFMHSILSAGGYTIAEADLQREARTLEQLVANERPAVLTLCGPDDAYANAVSEIEQAEVAVIAVGPPAAQLEQLGVGFIQEGDDVIALLTALAHGVSNDA